jgi:hypothetical protein
VRYGFCSAVYEFITNLKIESGNWAGSERVGLVCFDFKKENGLVAR